MLTFRKGTGGAPTAATAMAEHLCEQTIPEEMVAMVKRAEVAGTAIPRQDMPLAVAEALGIDVNRTVTHEEVVNLLQGCRADGEEIGRRQAYKVGAGKDRITTSTSTSPSARPKASRSRWRWPPLMPSGT